MSKKMSRGQYQRLAIDSINDAVECFDAGFFTLAEVNDQMGEYYLYKANNFGRVENTETDYEE